MNEKIAKELIEARKAVKRKYKALKSDVTALQIQQEKEFKPITEPLQELIKTIKSEQIIKAEPHSLFSPPKNLNYSSSSLKNKPERRQTNIYRKYLPSQIPSFLQDEETFIDEDVFLNTNDVPRQHESTPRIIEKTISEPAEITQNIQDLTKTPAYNEYLESFHPLVRSFVDDSVKSRRDLDHTHGLSHDVHTEKWKIGDSLADFEQKNFTVQNRTYQGTPGLYELLFFQNPVGYTSKDLDNYMEILQHTNAYRRNYDAKAQVQGTTDSKYLTIS